MPEHVAPVLYHAKCRDGGDAWFNGEAVIGTFPPSETPHTRRVVASREPGLRGGWLKGHVMRESWSPDGKWYGWYHDEYEWVPLPDAPESIRDKYWRQQDINPLELKQ